MVHDGDSCENPALQPCTAVLLYNPSSSCLDNMQKSLSPCDLRNRIPYVWRWSASRSTADPAQFSVRFSDPHTLEVGIRRQLLTVTSARPRSNLHHTKWEIERAGIRGKILSFLVNNFRRLFVHSTGIQINTL